MTQHELHTEIIHAHLERERENMTDAQTDIDRYDRIADKAIRHRREAYNRKAIAARKIDHLLEEYYPVMPAIGVDCGTD